MALLDSMPGENKAYTGAKGQHRIPTRHPLVLVHHLLSRIGMTGVGCQVGSVPGVFLIPGPQGLLEGVSVEDLGDGIVMHVLALKREGQNSVPRTHIEAAGVASVLVIPGLGR